MRRGCAQRPGDYGQLSRQRLMPGAFMNAGDYVGAQRRRLQMIAAVEDAFRDFDVLICASSMDPASRIEDAAETARTYPRQARTPFNVTGHPALAMMAGSVAQRDCRCRCSSSAATSTMRRCCALPLRTSAAPSGTRSGRRSWQYGCVRGALCRGLDTPPTGCAG